ncbi:DNA internalization-related competence protein ComEC/Rec2 [Comamonadaceae bacterium M7527]|nr:DNA internalization-related competence protein ComEC/Rec2 [Comamonadaceae bacterium M7527]
MLHHDLHTAALYRLAHWPGALLFGAPTAWMAGVATLMFQPDLWSAWCYSVLLALALLLLACCLCDSCGFFHVAQSRLSPWSSLLVSMLALAFLGFASTGLRATHRQALGIDPSMEGTTVWVRGRIASLVHSDELAKRWQFEVSHVSTVAPDAGAEPDWSGDQWQAWPTMIALSWYHGARGGKASAPLPELLATQQWLLPVRLKAPHGKRNPFGFDWELHAWSQGLSAVGYVASRVNQQAQLLAPARNTGWLAWRADTKKRIGAALASSPRVAGLLSALVVGDQDAIASADWDLFRDTGVAHLVSISGLHVTMFAWLAHALLWGFWRVLGVRLMGRANAPVPIAVGAALGALAYALFAGWGVPAQRTVLMLFAWAALKVFGLRWSWPAVWLCVLAVVAAWDPWSVLSAGFWLSFVAVAALLGAVDRQPSVAVDVPLSKRMLASLMALWRVQWRLSLVLAPLTWLLFGQVSVVGTLVNLLAIPLVSFVVLPLAMVGLLGGVTQWAWQLLVPIVQAALAGLQWAQHFAWAVAQPAALPSWLGVSVALSVFVMAAPWPIRWRLQWAWVVVVALLYTPPRPASGNFEMLAFDVGQGSAVLLRTHRHSLLFDAGPRYAGGFDTGIGVIVPHLLATGDHLDAVVLSHADNDHVGGSASVLQSGVAEGAVVWSSFAPPPDASHTYQACRAGKRWQWDGVWFEWMHPGARSNSTTWPRISRSQRNAQSCVLRVSNQQAVVWLMADAGVAQERAIMGRLGEQGQSALPTVLVAGHHGAATSTSAAWLNYVRPNWVVMQAGYRNRYAHPSAAVLRRLSLLASKWHMQWQDTVHCGAATWRSSQPRQLGCEREMRPKHWQHRP